MKLVTTGPVAGGRLDELAGEHDEPRGVVVLVLDVAREDLEPVGLGRQRWRDRRLGRGRRTPPPHGRRRRCRRRSPARRPCSRITFRHCPSACTWLCTVRMVSSDAPGSAIRANWMRRKCSPMMCRSESGRKWWMSATRPGDRVVDRDHRQLGVAALHGREHVLERRARHRLPVGVVQLAHHVGVGARLALVGDASPSVRPEVVTCPSFPRRGSALRVSPPGDPPAIYSRRRGDLLSPYSPWWWPRLRWGSASAGRDVRRNVARGERRRQQPPRGPQGTAPGGGRDQGGERAGRCDTSP